MGLTPAPGPSFFPGKRQKLNPFSWQYFFLGTDGRSQAQGHLAISHLLAVRWSVTFWLRSQWHWLGKVTQ